MPKSIWPRLWRLCAVLLLAAAGMTLVAAPAHARSTSGIMNEAASSIATYGGYVYVAPDAETQPSAYQVADLNAQIQAGPHTVYIAFVNARVKKELPGQDTNLLAEEFAQAVGLSGIYFVAAGPTSTGKQAVRAASTRDYPFDPAALATDAYNAYQSFGLDMVARQFVAEVEYVAPAPTLAPGTRPGDSVGSGHGPSVVPADPTTSGDGIGGALAAFILIVLGVAAAIGVAIFIWYLIRGDISSQPDPWESPEPAKPFRDRAPNWGTPGSSTVRSRGTEGQADEPERTGHRFTHVSNISDPPATPAAPAQQRTSRPASPRRQPKPATRRRRTDPPGGGGDLGGPGSSNTWGGGFLGGGSTFGGFGAAQPAYTPPPEPPSPGPATNAPGGGGDL